MKKVFKSHQVRKKQISISNLTTGLPVENSDQNSNAQKVSVCSACFYRIGSKQSISNDSQSVSKGGHFNKIGVLAGNTTLH